MSLEKNYVTTTETRARMTWKCNTESIQRVYGFVLIIHNLALRSVATLLKNKQ